MRDVALRAAITGSSIASRPIGERYRSFPARQPLPVLRVAGKKVSFGKLSTSLTSYTPLSAHEILFAVPQPDFTKLLALRSSFSLLNFSSSFWKTKYLSWNGDADRS